MKNEPKNCLYSHGRANLPKGWWDDPVLTMERREIVKSSCAVVNGKILELGLGEWLNGTFRRRANVVFPEEEKHTNDPQQSEQWRLMARAMEYMEFGESDEGGIDEDEAAHRAENYGFSNDEVQDLLSQGVKPWDDDAWVSTGYVLHHSHSVNPFSRRTL
jgi:hypothetical protein